MPKSEGLSPFPPILLCLLGIIPLWVFNECFIVQFKTFKIMSKEKTQNQNTDFDFENAEIVCSVKLSDFEKSEFKCRQNTNGKYYLLCLPSFTGLESALVAYASDGSGRKPSFSNDSLIIYQNDEDFAAMFGKGNYEEIDD